MKEESKGRKASNGVHFGWRKPVPLTKKRPQSQLCPSSRALLSGLAFSTCLSFVGTRADMYVCLERERCFKPNHFSTCWCILESVIIVVPNLFMVPRMP